MPAIESNNIVNVTHPSGASVAIDLYGATVTSWNTQGQERLFVSKQAIRDGSKAIRGGIPLVFPIFGTKKDVPLPQHGFARISQWKYLGIATDNHDKVTVQFGLSDEQLTVELHHGWPYSFQLEYTVSLTANTLHTGLRVVNKSNESFNFNTLLHTYFALQKIEGVSVKGLKGCRFDDKVSGATEESETREAVTIASEVDRVYRKAPDQLQLDTHQGSIGITKQGMCDTVVWNPWVDKAKAMGDFGDEEYHRMICVEVGSVADWVTLESGSTWVGGQTLTVQGDSI